MKLTSEEGSVALEGALVIPLLVACGLVVLIFGQLVLMTIDVHQTAALATRLVAVGEEHRVDAHRDSLTSVTITPPQGVRRRGDVFTVSVRRQVSVPLFGDRQFEIVAQAKGYSYHPRQSPHPR